MRQIEELKREGLSIKAISKLTGWDRKTIRKYLIKPDSAPVYGPRAPRRSKLDGFKPYIEERLKAGVWNARVLLRELRERGYVGSYTILTDRDRCFAISKRISLCFLAGTVPRPAD